MEELSIEQKAKAYDEALEKSKRLYEQGTITESLAYIFPELKESKDEMVRKAIIEHFEGSHSSMYPYKGFTKEQILAWLEKQYVDPIKEYWRGYNEGKQCVLDKHAELEKQGGQKPTDKPKFKVKYAGSEYNVFETKDIAGVTFYGIEDEPNHIDYVKAENCEIISGYAIKENGSPYPIKPAVFSEQKPAWSEEDETGLTNTIIMLKEGASLHFNKKDITKAVDWLKSLKPQNKWKPSEEMLEALYRAVPENVMEISEDEMLLDKLYQGLKYGRILSK